MGWAAVALELALAGLLIAALLFGWRLERRLKALRESHAAFVASVKDLDAAALRADAGLKALREALDEAHDGLHDRIQKGRALKAELEGLIARAERLPPPVLAAPAAVRDGRPAVAAAEPIRPATDARPRVAAPAEDEPKTRLPRFRKQGAA